MTHVTYERKAQLDAAAEERAEFLEEVNHQVAGVHVQNLIDDPEPYHAGAHTPAYHVPGNVEPDTTPTAEPSAPSAADLDSAPTVETKEYSDGTTATGVAPLPDQSPAQQEATQEEQSDPTTSNQSESAPIAESVTASPDASAPTEAQEQSNG